ncbi:claspin-like isoform X2 [Ornithodoros turicata]|uniref:claspin-like isoform X2 n=1 Tax=Ornithodoros turicata TaxID=34597 RepID=UPI0031397B20
MLVQAFHASDAKEDTTASQDVAVKMSSPTDQLCEPDVTGATDICHHPVPSCLEGSESGHMFHVNNEEHLNENIVADTNTDIQCKPKLAEQTIEAKTDPVNSINHCGWGDGKPDQLCKDNSQCESREHGSALQCNSPSEKWMAQAECDSSVSPCETSDHGPCPMMKDTRDVDESKVNEAIDQFCPIDKHIEHHQGLDEVFARMAQSSSEDEQEGDLETGCCSKKPAKRAQQELQEIYSEGQRMIRESPLSLPYHNPPRLSLKEFLSMRRGKTDMLPQRSLTPLRRCAEQPSEQSPSSTPVQKRRRLKEQLLQQMMEKREKVLEERLRQRKVYEEEVEEEEEALSNSESEESAVEDQDIDAVSEADAQEDSIVEEEDEEDIVSFRKRPKRCNPFIEDEAEDAKEYETGEEGEDEEQVENNEERDEGVENVGEDKEEEENFLEDKEPEGEKTSLWDSTLDDLNVFSPISGLTNVRYQGQHNKNFASCASSPANSLVSLSPLHHPELIFDKGAHASEPPMSKALWMSSQQASTQQEMDELIGLCSGSFDARASVDQDSSKLEDDNDEEHEGDSECADDRGGEDSEIEDVPVAPSDKKKGFRAQDFFEDEAELSGSDVGSDDEEDDTDEEQQLADLLAADTQPLDEEGIREEVGRLHFKHLLDQDKRELKIYQEMLLEDGDLHSEGGGRQRKFRWKSADAAFVDGPRDSDSEGEEAGNEDVAWRLQRFEREQWLRDQERKESPKKMHTNKLRVVTSVKRQEKERTEKVVCGSFLRMGSNALTRIAERLKVNRHVDNTGALTTKNFVFRSVDKKKEFKRPSSIPLIAPSCKKVKVSPLQSSSVFDHL